MRRNAWKDIANWRTKLLNHYTQSQLHELTTIQFKEEEMGSVGELSNVCSQIVLKCLYLARMARPENSSVCKQSGTSSHKMDRACDKRLARLISHIHHTCEYRQYCRVGSTAQQSRLRLISRFWSCLWLGRFEINIGRNIMYFWKSNICANKLDVQETDMSFSSVYQKLRLFLLTQAYEWTVSQLWIFGTWL